MHDQRKSAILSGSQRLNELGGQSGNWLQNHMVLIFENKKKKKKINYFFKFKNTS